MIDRTPPSDAAEPQTRPSHAGQECLTPSQREFARLLGRLLAERWDEQRENQTSGPSAQPEGKIKLP
jgi:hypothetical protein